MHQRHLFPYWIRSGAVALPVVLAACHQAPAPSEKVQLVLVPAVADPVSAQAVALVATVEAPSAATVAGPSTVAQAPVAAQVGGIVIRQPTPAPIPAPGLHGPLAMPSLPALPPPNKYPRSSHLPRGSDTEECGSVWSGTEYVPMECIDPEAHGSNARAAKVVIPYNLMRQPPETLPRIVDHRADGTEGPVRKQGSVPICTAMAFTAALDHAYARWTGQPGDFSVMQVWARYHKHEEQKAAGNNVGALLASEADWPFDPRVARSYGHCHGKVPTYDKPCDELPDADKLRSLDARPLAQITQVEMIAPNQLDVLREKLAGGQDAVLAIKMPTYATAGEPGSKYMIGAAKDPNAKLKGSHEVVLAGYAMTPNGNYYLVHNSFGTKWGDQGYAWLHESYMTAYSSDNLIVIPDVEPVLVEQLRARANGQLTAICAAGQAPDSISGMCAGLCPDGSPRHNNVCALDGSRDCPSGMVNLTGECLMSAPRSAGSDPTSGVGWACGPGGCAYAIPSGRLGCREAACAVSCPAPSFRLATMNNGLVCVE
jgi:hypothetical protein